MFREAQLSIVVAVKKSVWGFERGLSGYVQVGGFSKYRMRLHETFHGENSCIRQIVATF